MKPKRNRGFIVAIDGPAGAGKSTVSKQLAEALKGRLLDTGAMYRAVAYFAANEGCLSEREIGKIARRLKFKADTSGNSLLVNGETLGARLRTEKASKMASVVSQYKSVREVLTRRQRTLAKEWSKKIPVVVEGRDIGTVVFPDVEFKFYVTASAEVRAERRYQQLKKNNARGVTYKAILKKILERDKRDSGRKHAPLKCAKDAVIVDTSHMGIHQVVLFMTAHILQRIMLTHR